MLSIALVLLLIIGNFYFLPKKYFTIDVGMMLMALIALIMSGPEDAAHALHFGFYEFAPVALLFTAVAVPAHVLQRSDVLDWIGMKIGELIGRIKIRLPRLDTTFLICFASLFMTYVMAALFHNTTSIIVTVSIIAILCKSYKIPAIPVLCSALVASNLGGFSTRWGDTPNIVEAMTWNLGHGPFFTQILPINVGLMMVLIIYTTFVIKFLQRHNKSNISSSRLAYSMVEFRSRRRNTKLNMRLLWVGLIGLTIAIIGPFISKEYELLFSAAAIIFVVMADYSSHRQETLFTLGIETYGTLLAIFILAQVVADSHIGIQAQITQFLVINHVSTWSVIIASYFGTLLTEAASWASAASTLVHSMDSSTRTAWALGAGICAGSSALVTSATAGILLMKETQHNEIESRVSFMDYLKYGFTFSLVMIVYYVFVLTGIYKI